MRNLVLIGFIFQILLVAACSRPADPDQTAVAEPDFEAEVEEYIRRFPYQDTYDYVAYYTGGDPAKMNTWSFGESPAVFKAGEDRVVRSNNDTYYKFGFLDLSAGPVTLYSLNPAVDRFYSYQLMDDRNVNFRNLIKPDRAYTLYRGSAPEEADGELIEAPSDFVAVTVRVEVKDLNDPADVKMAQLVFGGLTIDGPEVAAIRKVDLLSGFSEEVVAEAERRIEEKTLSTPLNELIVKQGQTVGEDVPYINLAAGTKCCIGGPDPSHSDYEMVFTDSSGETLEGSKGAYTLTMTEPPVDAFWSITVYDSERGGFLHPNDDDRYHFNNTTAVRNEDGTVSFLFKTECGPSDPNCLAVPVGPFDVVGRYYLPRAEVISREWSLPDIKLAE